MSKLWVACVILLALTTACGNGEQDTATSPNTGGSATSPPSTATDPPSETATSSSAQTGTGEIDAPRQIVRCLPASGTKAEIIVPDAPPRVAELQTQFAEAARKNPSKLKKLILEHPGEALPYRKWMGLTRAEYRELDQLMAQASSWGQRVVATEPITATVTDNEAVLDAAGHLAPFNDVRIDLGDLSVDTAAGRINNPERLQAEGAAGRLDGFHWARDAGAVTFDIAMIEGTDQCLMQFVSGDMTATGGTLTVRYPQSQ